MTGRRPAPEERARAVRATWGPPPAKLVRWVVRWGLFETKALRPLHLGRARPPTPALDVGFETRAEAEAYTRKLFDRYGRDRVALTVIDVEGARARKAEQLSFAGDWPIQKRRPKK